MASTWSALKIELLETGANAGSWGTLTNVNLGDAVLGEAITGQATVDFASDADVTITLTDSATTQAARNLRLNITESSSGVGSVRNLILGSGCQIEKFYLINNTGTGAKTIKNTSGTGISVPAGKATLVYNNGTNVVDAASYFTSLTLGSALPVASGGTGLTAGTSGGVLAYTASGTLASSAALTQYGVVYGGGAGAVPVATANGTTGQAFIATTSGAPSWGTLPVAGGGTGLTAGTSGGIPAYTASGTLTSSGVLAQYGVVIGGGAGAVPTSTAVGTATHVLTSNGAGVAPTFQALPAGGVTTFTAGTTGFTPSTATSGAVTLAGTLAVANGGTGQTTYTNGQLLIGNTTGNTLTKATLTQGTGITVTNSTGSITVANAGVTSNVAGTGISVSGATGAVTITNSGVTSIVAGTGISVSGATGAVTVTNTSSSNPPTQQRFTSSGTWTRPSGCKTIFVQLVGGGGNGNSDLGASGGYSQEWIDVTGTSSVSVTVGAGAPFNSSNGGTTSFGSFLSATGGTGAYLAGVGSGGDLNLRGYPLGYIGGDFWIASGSTPLGVGTGRSLGSLSVATGFGGGGYNNSGFTAAGGAVFVTEYY
jgi:hypothetical protein